MGSMVGAAGFAVSLTPVAIAAALPHLTAQDPQALALHYTEDASKLDASKNPSHTAGAKCANRTLRQAPCRQSRGSESRVLDPSVRQCEDQQRRTTAI